MSPIMVSVLMLAFKMGVAGSFGIAVLFGLNWFNNFEIKKKKTGGGDNEINDLRKRLANRQ